MRPLHLICSGGVATGPSPTTATAGYIELSDGVSNTGRYVLNSSNKEYFRFKNPDYQSGIVSGQSGFKFGINDWQFPTGSEFTPNPPPQYSFSLTNNVKIISPIKFGPTAFWNTSNAADVRIKEASQSVFKDYSDFTGRSANTAGLIGWWEMQTNNGVISGMNNSSKQLIISGDSPLTLQSSSVGNVLVAEIINGGKQSIDLPFGGFPGTEKYG